MGLFMPLPFWLVWKFSPPKSKLAKFMKYLNLPIILLYIGWLPYSVNGTFENALHTVSIDAIPHYVGQWWSCMVIGVYSQWWLRTRRPNWFAKVGILLISKERGFLIHIAPV